MPLTPEALEIMADLGISLKDAARIARAMEAEPKRSTAALRQARYRERVNQAKAAGSTADSGTAEFNAQQPESVTSDVTCDVNSDVTSEPRKGPYDINNSTLKPSSLRSVRERARATFADSFWPAYPAKPGNPRAVAEKKFIKLIETGEDEAAILAGVRAFAASARGTDPQFIPMASTWLNQRRWADDFTERIRPAPTRANTQQANRFNADRGYHDCIAALDRRDGIVPDSPSPDWDGPTLDFTSSDFSG